MTILAAAGSAEEGSNFNPPTLGEFMRAQKISKIQVLRESRAGASVIKEAREFHERQALKHGINTRRGLAHVRASRLFSREAGTGLQEKFENGGDQLGELPPKAVIKANKAAMMFHKKQAEKHGLDSDLGHAHTAAMEHHMDVMKKAKDQQKQPQQGQMPQQPQQPMQASREGGPGSGRHKGGGSVKPSSKEQIGKMFKKDKTHIMSRTTASLKQAFKDAMDRDDYRAAKRINAELGNRGEKFKNRLLGDPKVKIGDKHTYYEAAPGKSGKQSPVPVPQKSDMPNQDVRMPLPPVPLSKLQQGKDCGMMASREGGPGSGRHKGSGKDAQYHYDKADEYDRKHDSATSQAARDRYHAKAQEHYDKAYKLVHYGESNRESGRIRRIDRFGEDAMGRIGKSRNPSKINKQLGDEKIFRGEYPDRKNWKDNTGLTTKEARRRLHRSIWESDDSERDRSASGLTA